MNDIVIVRPSPPDIVGQLAPIVREAMLYEVREVASHGEALERAKRLRSGERSITDYFEPARKAADAAKREILAARDGLVGPVVMARQLYDRKAQDFEAEERRKAEELERELRERARIEEEERQLMAAIDAEESGDAQAAEAILAAPVEVPQVRVAPAVAEIQGVSERELWSAEVHDLQALVSYVAGHPEWIGLLEPCMPTLNKLAQAQRGALRIPGVRAVSRVSRSYRA